MYLEIQPLLIQVDNYKVLGWFTVHVFPRLSQVHLPPEGMVPVALRLQILIVLSY